MRSSINFSDILKLFCLGVLLWLTAGTAGAAGIANNPAATTRIAVLPIINLSGSAAPLRELRTTLLAEAANRGVALLGEAELEQFMARHRLRYTGGVDAATAQAFHDETGVDGLLVTVLQQYDPLYPAKIALDARLVTAAAPPQIVWADAVAMAGDDAPGLFGLGLIENPRQLATTAISRLAGSLAAGVRAGDRTTSAGQAATGIRPRLFFRSPGLAAVKPVKVAVVPFFNRSQRNYAGEILALQFVRELARQGGVTVIEPGVVRQKFLAFRIIMDEGLSLANAGVLFEVLGVDLIVSGDVMEYDDYQGSLGTPRVAFSAWLIDHSSQRVVWGSESHNSGDDRVYFFDIGKQRTAHLLAQNMVRGVVTRIFPPTAPEAAASTPAGAGTRPAGLLSTPTTKEGEL